jgi:hypothetical protein
VGIYYMRALYLGDATYAPSTSNPAQITVTDASGLHHFTIANYPTTVTAGLAFSNNVVITAYDINNNVLVGYTGSIYFMSTDMQATLPYTSILKYTFTGSGTGKDNGVHSFPGSGFVLKIAGSQTITVTDGAISKTSSPISVTPATASPKIVFVIGGSQTLSVNKRSSPIGVQLQDLYGNTISASSQISITLSSTGTGRFYSSQTGTTQITSINIEAGSTTSVPFYYMNSVAEVTTLSASRSGYTTGQTVFTTTNKAYTPIISSTITPQTGIALNTPVTDRAVLVGASATPTGTITYRLYRGVYPFGVLVDSDPVTITGGVIPSSKAFTGTTVKGPYYFLVEYSGDAQNNLVPGNNPEPFVVWPTENTVLIAPNANTDDRDLTPVGNTQNYICVQSNDGDTTYVRPDSGSTYDYFWTDDTYALQDQSFTNYNYIVVHIVCRTTGSGYALSSIETHNTEYDGSNSAFYYSPLTSTYTDYTSIYSVNPYTGVAWTAQEINDLRVGVSLFRISGEERCTQVYVQIYYTP